MDHDSIMSGREVLHEQKNVYRAHQRWSAKERNPSSSRRIISNCNMSDGDRQFPLASPPALSSQACSPSSPVFFASESSSAHSPQQQNRYEIDFLLGVSAERDSYGMRRLCNPACKQREGSAGRRPNKNSYPGESPESAIEDIRMQPALSRFR